QKKWRKSRWHGSVFNRNRITSPTRPSPTRCRVSGQSIHLAREEPNDQAVREHSFGKAADEIAAAGLSTSIANPRNCSRAVEVRTVRRCTVAHVFRDARYAYARWLDGI